METTNIKKCGTCQYTFLDRNDQVLHYKLDWHLYNIKQSLRSQITLTEDQFNRKCDQEDNDLSSLSGSDSEQELEEVVVSQYMEQDTELTNAAIRSPHVVINIGSSFYKCFCNLLFHRKQELDNDVISNSFTSLFTEDTSKTPKFSNRIAIFLYSAQHFAGAVYENDKLLLHKTYHRYTVRAKQGTVQGVRDGKGNAPKSLGSSLRRYNQIALFNDIEALLHDWGSELQKCCVIFHRTAAYNMPVFEKLKVDFLNNSNDKIRTVPFMTYRPTLKETKRVFTVLTSLTKSNQEEFDAFRLPPEPENFQNLIKISHIQKSNPKSIPNSHLKQRKMPDAPKKPKSEIISKVPWYEDRSHIVYHLIEAIRNKDVILLEKLLNKEHIPDAVEIELFSINAQLKDNNTLLHLAAMTDNIRLTRILLYNGANPELMNLSDKVPYEVALNKNQRDEFRRYMAAVPSQWDYKVAKVPSPLTKAMEEEQERKKQEKKKAQRQAKAARQKQKKAAEKEEKKKEEEKLVAETQKLRMKQLTPRERCLLAAEARVAANKGLRGSTSGMCNNCETGLDGLVPFERLNYKYCSVTCVKEHRVRMESS